MPLCSVELAHLLIGERGIVGADEQAGFRTEILHPRLRVRDLVAQTFDLARQPLAGGFGLRLPRILLQHQIAVDDRIGDARRKLRIARLEFDDDDARLVDRVSRQAIEIGVQHPLLRRHRERIADDTQQPQERLQRRYPLQHRIEFRPLGEPVLLDDLARQIAGEHELNLARHRLGIERGALLVALAVRPQEDILASVDQDARFGLVAGSHEIDGGRREHGGKHRGKDDPAFPARKRRTERPQIEIAGFRCTGHVGVSRRRLREGLRCLRLLPTPTPER